MIMAIVELNIKSLLKDKISILWATALPTVILFFNLHSVTRIEHLIVWYCYMATSSFLFGIGIYAATERMNGHLRTIFSIKNRPGQYFIAQVITQVFFNLISMSIFNMVASFLLRYHYLNLMLYSIISIIICLPIAFIGYNLTLLKNIHTGSLSTIASILIFIMFMMLFKDTVLNYFNPMYLEVLAFNILSAGGKGMEKIIVLFVYLMVILSGLYSINHYTCISKEKR